MGLLTGIRWDWWCGVVHINGHRCSRLRRGGGSCRDWWKSHMIGDRAHIIVSLFRDRARVVRQVRMDPPDPPVEESAVYQGGLLPGISREGLDDSSAGGVWRVQGVGTPPC